MRYFDFHCDTLSKLQVRKALSNTESLMMNKLAVSLDSSAGLKAYVQTFAIWTPENTLCTQTLARFIDLYNLFMKEVALHSDSISFCRTGREIRSAGKAGKVAGILSVEGGAVICGSLEILNDLYKMGVRIFSLTWNDRNSLADGVKVAGASGLTPLGKQVVQEMNRLGMILDVSHLADPGFWDVCGISDRPFMATHSNSRTVCSHERNLTNDQFKEIARRGGVVGINFGRAFLSNDPKQANADSLMRHVETFLSLGGEHAVAMGSDFDGTEIHKELDSIAKVGSIAEAMLRRNYSESLVDDILYGNALRFFEQNAG